MFAHGSHGDADHRGADAEADASTLTDANFRSHEAALPVTDASAECVSNCTTDRATQSGTDRVADRCTDTSTFSAANCATDRATVGSANRPADG